jgi:hypothetical protein
VKVGYEVHRPPTGRRGQFKKCRQGA